MREIQKLNRDEIIKTTKKEKILHIASNRRMCEIFCVEGLSAVKYFKNSFTFSCCGKVSPKFGGCAKAMVGYIMDETSSYWIIKFCSNKTIRVKKAPCNNGTYVLCNCIVDNRSDIVITQYWPIRIKLNRSGKSSLTLNRLVLNRQLDIKVNL